MSQPATVLDYAAPAPRRLRGFFSGFADQLGLLVALALLIAAFSFGNRYFFSVTTFTTIANQIPATVLTAVGMTYVLVLAEIDLSVGSVLALSGAVIGTLMVRYHAPLPLALIAALAAGALCGAVNGLVTVTWSLPSFVVTLGMLEIARGATHLLTNSRTEYIGSAVGGLADVMLFRLSLPFYLCVIAVIVAQFVLTRTIFGRYLVAVGTNQEAVRLSGIATRPIKFTVFLLSGFLAAAGSIMDVSRAQAATPNAGNGLELDVIAAVVIGGTSLMGGRGSVISSFLGVILIAVLSAGLASIGVRDETKRLITGCVIVLAVILDYYRRRLANRRS
jgi:ribose transport system permease protein